jgi:protein-S-isoprenylcysteine O-methyltransferase Ste14
MFWRTVLRSLIFFAVLGAVLFTAAGRLDWPGGYAFLAAMGTGVLVMEGWLALFDPALLKERRNHKQAKPLYDRILLPLLFMLFPVWLITMAIDIRIYGIAQMPRWANYAGAVVVFLAFVGNIAVFRANRFATAIVKVQETQTVSDRGPYRIVRHPMYGLGVLTYFAIPFALGSWVGLAGAPFLALLLAIRVVFEEGQLKRELAGYEAYMGKVRYRLVPYVW